MSHVKPRPINKSRSGPISPFTRVCSFLALYRHPFFPVTRSRVGEATLGRSSWPSISTFPRSWSWSGWLLEPPPSPPPSTSHLSPPPLSGSVRMSAPHSGSYCLHSLSLSSSLPDHRFLHHSLRSEAGGGRERGTSAIFRVLWWVWSELITDLLVFWPFVPSWWIWIASFVNSPGRK